MDPFKPPRPAAAFAGLYPMLNTLLAILCLSTYLYIAFAFARHLMVESELVPIFIIFWPLLAVIYLVSELIADITYQARNLWDRFNDWRNP